jgi:hypothetical protein
MNVRPVLLIIAAAMRLAATSPCPCADVQLTVTDLLGDAVPISTPHFIGDGRDEAGWFKNGRASTVPYGRYEMTVIVPGFNPWEREVEIRNARVVIPVGMEAGRVEAPPKFCSVKGGVPGLSHKFQGRPLWIRAQAVFGYQSFATEITEDRFGFENLPCGKYLMVAISCTEIAATVSTLVDWHNKTIEIPVGNGNSSK